MEKLLKIGSSSVRARWTTWSKWIICWFCFVSVRCFLLPLQEKVAHNSPGEFIQINTSHFNLKKNSFVYESNSSIDSEILNHMYIFREKTFSICFWRNVWRKEAIRHAFIGVCMCFSTLYQFYFKTRLVFRFGKINFVCHLIRH